MESSSIPTAGNATTKKQVAVALLHSQYKELCTNYDSLVTLCNERIIQCDKCIVQCNKDISQCNESIIEYIKHEIHFNKLCTQFNKMKDNSHVQEVVEPILDIIQKVTSINNAELISTQARVKTLIQQKQGLFEERATLVKVVPEL